MSLTKTALRFAAPVPQAEAFERYLFIGPHPDDIEIGAGATAAKLAAAGKQVSFLVCMDGRYGLENAPASTTPEELTVLRKEEAIASARLLGVSDIHFLELCDGGAYDTDALLSGPGDRKSAAADPLRARSGCHIRMPRRSHKHRRSRKKAGLFRAV